MIEILGSHSRCVSINDEIDSRVVEDRCESGKRREDKDGSRVNVSLKVYINLLLPCVDNKL